MNFMGMGMLEVLVILLVAFRALGPSRSITMAKIAGKVMSDLRRTFGEVTAAAGMEQVTQQAREAVASIGTELSTEQPRAERTPAPRGVDQTDEQSAVGEETPAAMAEEHTDQVSTSENSAADGAEQLTEQATAGQDSPTAANKEEPTG